MVTARRADQRAQSSNLTAATFPWSMFSRSAKTATPCRSFPMMKAVRSWRPNICWASDGGNIAHVTGPEGFEAVRLRQQGLCAGPAAGGNAATRRSSICQAHGRKPGAARRRRSCCSLAGRQTRYSAAMTRSPGGHIRASARSRRSVPRDISVVGYRQLGSHGRGLPGRDLTSIDMNLMALGREAGRALMRLMAGEELTGVQAVALLAGRPQFLREPCQTSNKGRQ